MPLSGGEADKIGNRYEDWWTVSCMIDVIDEEAESIRLEPPEVEEGFEFELKRKNRREFHQIKRQQSTGERWSLSKLENKSVLSNFWNKLQDSQNWCVFISTQDALQLHELSDRARGAISLKEYSEKILPTNQKLPLAFEELRRRWQNCSEQEAYETLKRVQIQTVAEDFLQNTVKNRLKPLILDDPVFSENALKIGILLSGVKTRIPLNKGFLQKSGSKNWIIE